MEPERRILEPEAVAISHATHPAPTMTTLRALYRLLVALVLILLASLGLLLTAWMPLEIQGVRLSSWTVTWLARAVLALFQVRVTCTSPQRLRRHRGLILCNHSSFLDILALLSIMPVRFLSAAEVGRIWPVGWMARKLGTVFVDRQTASSRSAALRHMVRILRSRPYPPLVIFPEGRLDPGDRLLPFRVGTFRLAVRYRIPLLPCAIRYDRPDATLWRFRLEEEVLSGVWRILHYSGPYHVLVIPLDVRIPGPQDDPTRLAQQIRQDMGRILGLPLADEGAPLPGEG